MSLSSKNTSFITAGSDRYWGALFALLVIAFFVLTLLLYPAAVGQLAFPFECFALISIIVPFGSILFQKKLDELKEKFQAQTVGQLYAGYYQNQSLPFLLWGLSFFIVCLFLAALFSLSGNLIDLLRSDGTAAQIGDQSTQLAFPLHFTLLIATIGLFTSPLFTQLSFMTNKASLRVRQQMWGIGFCIGALLLSVPLVIWVVAPSFKLLPLSPAFVFLGVITLFLLGAMGLFLVGLLYRQAEGDLSSISKSSYEGPQGHTYFASLFIGLVIAVSAGLSFVSGDDALQLGWPGVALGFQMVPALIGLRFVPWFTGHAIFYGLIVGILIVLFTDVPGLTLIGLFLTDLSFSSHPLQIFSGVWGLAVNLLVVFIVSAFTQTRNSFEHRAQLHEHCLDHNHDFSSKLGSKLFTWVLCFVWFFFAIGPGAGLGLHFFTQLDLFKDLPSPLTPLWIWCALWWGIGVTMLSLLCRQLKLN